MGFGKFPGLGGIFGAGGCRHRQSIAGGSLQTLKFLSRLKIFMAAALMTGRAAPNIPTAFHSWWNCPASGNRVRVADAEKTKTHYVRDAAGLDLIRDVTVALRKSSPHSEVTILEEEQKRWRRKCVTALLPKVEDGKEPPIQKTRRRSSARPARLPWIAPVATLAPNNKAYRH